MMYSKILSQLIILVTLIAITVTAKLDPECFKVGAISGMLISNN